MIKKKIYPANTPEMKKFSQSHIYRKKKWLCIKFDHSSRILPKYVYIIETPLPTTPLREGIGLFSSRNLQVTISRVSRWLHTRECTYIVSVKW